MRITESQLRKIIRKEIRRLREISSTGSDIIGIKKSKKKKN